MQEQTTRKIPYVTHLATLFISLVYATSTRPSLNWGSIGSQFSLKFHSECRFSSIQLNLVQPNFGVQSPGVKKPCRRNMCASSRRFKFSKQGIFHYYKWCSVELSRFNSIQCSRRPCFPLKNNESGFLAVGLRYI